MQAHDPVIPRWIDQERRKQFVEAFKDFVYPPCCPGCGARGVWVCEACAAEAMVFCSPWCTSCGIPDETGDCRCALQPASLRHVRSVGWHEAWVQQSVTALKYGNEPDRATHLGGLLAGQITDLGSDLILSPVPLHATRLRTRGYNQSERIALAVSAVVHLPVKPLLRRTRNTNSQVGLSEDERQTNVFRAFELVDEKGDSDTKSRPVLLIDDVFTTGATIGECARVLLEAGHPWVAAATVSRAR